MPTDFFERQAQAHRSTWWLVVMFAVAVIGLVGGTMVVTAVILQYYQFSDHQLSSQRFPWEIPLGAGAAALLLICSGSLFKVAQLRAGGGTGVAERLGGRRIYPNTSDPAEKRLLNVVEEMSLAAGIPVLPIFYLSEEEGINAFAAGYSSSDAVLGVTRGAAEGLSRDQLQGVIGHELSHVLNGDMRMNIRLIGVLHGILLLGLVGRIVVRALSHGGHRSSRRDSKDSGGGAMMVILLIGFALIVLGSIGTLIGNLIKAAVSRQREYLADASAVQFTRNPDGLAGALKRIGAAIAGSKLVTPAAAEASHMYFAQGVWEGFTGLMATHPPLRERILRLDPQWDGKLIADGRGSVADISSETAAGLVGAVEQGRNEEVPAADIAESVRHVGNPIESHREYAAALLRSLPRPVNAAAHDPYGVRAVLYALLLDRDATIRERQYARLEQFSEPDVVVLTRQLQPAIFSIDVRSRLPLVDLALPTLRAISPAQYRDFDQCFRELVEADNRLGLFEWALAQILMRHLRPQFETVKPPQVRFYGLAKLGHPCSILLSTLAHSGHAAALPESAFAAGAALLPETSLTLLPAHECGLGPLRTALAELVSCAPKLRVRLVGACAATICADDVATVEEAELLRGIADLLECPMPPILAGQKMTGEMTNDE
ncbi:MAG: M48 family metallopeptidase [Pirellulales bacterium]